MSKIDAAKKRINAVRKDEATKGYLTLAGVIVTCFAAGIAYDKITSKKTDNEE